MSRTPWRRRLLATAAVSPLIALAACGGGGGTAGGGGEAAPEAAACAPSEGPVELTFTSWVPGVEEAVALWNEQNPDIQVTAESVPAGNAGTYNNLFNGLQAGTAPDLSQVEYDSLSSFRLQEGLVNIAECPGISDASGQFVDWTWSQAQLGDEGVYAVPQDTGPMALYYRKDLFDAAGIAAPTTWEEYYQAAVALKASDPNLRITHFPQVDANWFTGLLWQNQASLFELEGDNISVTVDSPESQEVAQYWQRMIDEDLIATNLQGFSPDLYAAWNNGTVASWVSAAWGYSTIRDNAPDTSGQWAVAPMPKWEGGEDSAGRSSPAVAAGNRPPSRLRISSDSGFVFSHSANSAASAGCSVPVSTAVVEPPQLPALSSPPSHFGMGATAHCPEVSGALSRIVE